MDYLLVGNLLRRDDDDPRVSEIRLKFNQIAKEYFEPLKYKNTRQIIDYLESHREAFGQESNDLLRTIFISAKPEQIIKDLKNEVVIDGFLKMIANNFPKDISERFYETTKMEIQNEIAIFEMFFKNPNSSVIFITLLKENIVKISTYINFLLGALIEFGLVLTKDQIEADERLYDSLMSIVDLATDYVEEKDTFVETFLILANPKEKQDLLDSLNAKGRKINSREELEAWAKSL